LALRRRVDHLGVEGADYVAGPRVGANTSHLRVSLPAARSASFALMLPNFAADRGVPGGGCARLLHEFVVLLDAHERVCVLTRRPARFVLCWTV
jgi:hypothetical protein